VARPEKEPILSRKDLDDLKRRLAMLSVPGVEGIYKSAHDDCKFDGERVPAPAAIQQLVTVWKVLRKSRRRT